MRKLSSFKAKPISSKVPKVSPAGLSSTGASLPGMPKPKSIAAAPHERFTPKKSIDAKSAFAPPSPSTPGAMAFPSEPGSMPGAGS